MKKYLTLLFAITIAFTSCLKKDAAESKPVAAVETPNKQERIQQCRALNESQTRTEIWENNLPPLLPGSRRVYWVEEIKSFPRDKGKPNDGFVGVQHWEVNGYSLDRQGDGNLVLYDHHNGQLKALWAVQATYNRPNSFFSLQTDLNMVAIDNGQPIWDSHTQVFDCPTYTPPAILPTVKLCLGSDGEFFIGMVKADGNSRPTYYVLASTRTRGGVQSPNYGSLYIY